MWQYLIAGFLGVALLTTGGIIWLSTIGNSQFTSAPSSSGTGTQQAPVQAEIDPEATVVILDGTPDAGKLAAAVDVTIREEQWGNVVSAGPADASDVEISAVFFWDPADEAAARGLAEKLGGVTAYQSDVYQPLGSQLVVLLGADYAGPHAEIVDVVTPVPEPAPSPEGAESETETDDGTGVDEEFTEETFVE